MKFKHFAIIALLTATAALFTSCAKDEDPTEQNPTVNFKGGAAYVSADATLPAGSDFTIGINAASNTESNAKLVKFTVVRTFNNLPTTVLDSTMDASSLNFENTYQVKTEAGAERWTFEVTDKDGNKSSVSLNITTGAVANVYTAILMGGQLNKIGRASCRERV